MPSLSRLIVLCGLLALAYAAQMLFGRSQPPAPARWPEGDSLFQVSGWTVGPASVVVGDGDVETGALVSRTYFQDSAVGQHAEFALWATSEPQAKLIYRKGPDRDFLGEAYTVEPAPNGLVKPIAGGGALIARRGPTSWLLLYTFGERRGRLGTDGFAWSAAEWDALFDRPNQYFLARVSLPFSSDQAPPVMAATALADPLFSRLGEWYAKLGQ